MFKSQIEQFRTAKSRAASTSAELSRAEQFWRKFKDADGARFADPGLSLAGGYNWLDALGAARRALDTLQKIGPSAGTPFPTPVLGDLLKALSDLEAQLPQLVAFQQAVSSESRPLKIISAGVAAVAADGAVIMDCAPTAVAIVGAADRLATATGLLGTLTHLSATSGPKGPEPDLADYAAQAITALKEAEQAREKSDRARELAEAAATSLQALLEQAKAQLASADDLLAKATAAADAAAANASTVSATTTANAATAAAKVEEITRLAAQAEASHTALTSYAATLAETKVNVAAAEAKAAAVVAAMEEKNIAVQSLIDDAEKMVSGATVAGLAKAFADEKNYLERSMNGTFIGFCIGIALLTVTSFGLAAYVLHIPITIWKWQIIAAPKPGDPGYEITIAGVLSRAIILLGPFWLTLFSARRYRSLFDLRQQYSHKYNMAFSMNGFKTQSPDNAQNIAAWVFSIVASNPIVQRPGGPIDEAPSTSVSDMVNGAAGALGNLFKGKS